MVGSVVYVLNAQLNITWLLRPGANYVGICSALNCVLGKSSAFVAKSESLNA